MARRKTSSGKKHRQSKGSAKKAGPPPRKKAASRPRTRSLGHVKGKPTIRAVAERAGVAVSTVSRVMNQGYASPAARKRVEAAVRELSYTPSTTARSLVTGRTGSIGVVVESSQGPWFTQLLGGIEEELAASRYSVILASLGLKGRYDASAVAAWITEHRVDGLILVRYTKRERRLLKAATKAGLPVVLIAPDEPARVGFTVRCRNIKAGRLAADHLLDLGHRRIAFAGGPEDSLDSRDRLDGLREGIEAQGLKLSARDVWFGKNYNPETGMEYAEQFLQRSEKTRTTAVVLGNDAMALGFMRTVLQRGLRVPDDVSVVGFDGIPDGALFWPGLTTVIQPTRLMGSTACRALLDRIADADKEDLTTVEYGVELEVRESTAAPTRSGRAKSS